MKQSVEKASFLAMTALWQEARLALPANCSPSLSRIERHWFGGFAHLPDGGYFHPGMRWVSLLCHVGISAMLGWLVGPWQIYKAVRKIRQCRVRVANTSVRVGPETV